MYHHRDIARSFASFMHTYLRLIVALWLLFRLWLAWALPMTGDEAYFVLWGRFPDWGYYDHPPMVGWWLAALLPLGDSPLYLRLPSVLLPLVLAWATYHTVQEWGKDKARLATLLILLAPANVWNVLITTDTPLVFFAVLSALAFIRGFLRASIQAYILCGLLLAGAVLSKYFAALLGLAFLLATLLAPTRHRISGLAIIAALVLPALALMLWWNATNCWPNVLFNLVNRNAKAGFQVWQPLLFGLTMIYMLGFWPCWFALKRPAWLNPLQGTAEDRLYWSLAVVPVGVFALLSLSKTIGLHWVLAFIPLILLALLRQMSLEAAERAVRGLAGLGLIHVALLFLFAALPLSVWQNTTRYAELVWTFRTPELIQAAGADKPDRHWFTDGYTYAAELSYARDRLMGRSGIYGGEHIGVFGPGSHYARQDDRLSDFRRLDGQNLGLILRHPPETGDYAPYFAHLETTAFEVAGARFYRVLGEGFRYEVYRQRVLSEIRQRFYQFPDWLPDCGCFFGPRYFPPGQPAG